MSEPSFAPRLNHVAISMDPALLDDAGRAELLDFYGEVFGWTEGDNTGEVGNPLIMYTGAFGQFVYLLPGDPYLRAPAMDHFGLQVATIPELLAIVERAKARQGRDERVTVIDVHARTTPGPTHDYTLTSAYIGFVLPLLIELQHLERHEHVPSAQPERPPSAPIDWWFSGRAFGQSGAYTFRRGADRDSRGSGRRFRHGVVAAARDGRHGRPDDHDRLPAQQVARDRARGRAHAHRAAQRLHRVLDVPGPVGNRGRGSRGALPPPRGVPDLSRLLGSAAVGDRVRGALRDRPPQHRRRAVHAAARISPTTRSSTSRCAARCSSVSVARSRCSRSPTTARSNSDSTSVTRRRRRDRGGRRASAPDRCRPVRSLRH